MTFDFFTYEEKDVFEVMSILSDDDKGYMLEVDLEHPPKLQDRHSDYPLAPDTKSVTDEMLSPYSSKLWRKLNPISKISTVAKKRVQIPKFLTTLED